jgi:hypothetical protein
LAASVTWASPAVEAASSKHAAAQPAAWFAKRIDMLNLLSSYRNNMMIDEARRDDA